MSIKTHASKCNILTSDPEDTGCNCDGYHTFDELYEHRIELFITVCRVVKDFNMYVWRSKQHHDGTSFDGWFIMGVETEPGEQITYHLPDSRWQDTNFAETLERAPKWDGHTSDDVLERLKSL